jgi:hypothetical protein
VKRQRQASGSQQETQNISSTQHVEEMMQKLMGVSPKLKEFNFLRLQ